MSSDAFAEDEIASGTQVGRYTVSRLLGQGGCASVYAAADPEGGTDVALKVMHGELAAAPKMVERFLQEVGAVQRIQHPAIVRIHGVGAHDGRPYYVMDLLRGEDLDTVLGRTGRFSVAEALAILTPVCQALSVAHEAGIIHRDIKAENIFVVDPEAGGLGREIKLVDFGVAKLLQGDRGGGLTSFGRVLGTPVAMAPEQIRGGVIDARADVYALGALLFRMLTGRHPFESDDPIELELAHLESVPPHPSRFGPVSPAVEGLILRCLAKRPEGRPPSALAFLEEVRRAAGGPPASVTSVMAVGVHVATRIRAGEDEDEALDEALDDVDGVLELADSTLRGAGFALPLLTGNSLLAVRILPDDPADRRRRLTEAVEVSRSLVAALAARPDAAAAVDVGVCVHCAPASVEAGEQLRVTGDILRVATWATEVGDAVLSLTAELEKELQGLA